MWASEATNERHKFNLHLNLVIWQTCGIRFSCCIGHMCCHLCHTWIPLRLVSIWSENCYEKSAVRDWHLTLIFLLLLFIPPSIISSSGRKGLLYHPIGTTPSSPLLPTIDDSSPLFQCGDASSTKPSTHISSPPISEVFKIPTIVKSTISTTGINEAARELVHSYDTTLPSDNMF